MLNEEKIKYMTRAAAYEDSEGKKNIEISEYYRGDYLSFYMLRSAIAYTVAYMILLAMWASYGMQEIMEKISRMSYVQGLVRNIVLIYAAGLLIYEIAAYCFFSWRYKKARQSVSEFNENLKNLRKFYEEDSGAAGERTTVQGEDENDDDFGV